MLSALLVLGAAVTGMRTPLPALLASCCAASSVARPPRALAAATRLRGGQPQMELDALLGGAALRQPAPAPAPLQSDTVSTAVLPPTERAVGLGFILSYLWPAGREWRARLRVGASLGLLVFAKLFIVRVPFFFKRAIDALGDGGLGLKAGLAWMVAYGLARAVNTFLEEGSYFFFAPVGQNALRRFTADAFAHVQGLDALWLQRQSTGELSRVFARGTKGMNSLLLLVVFSVGPVFLETALALGLLGRHYGGAFFTLTLGATAAVLFWSVFLVQRRVALTARINDNDNSIFNRFFNALLCNEAVRWPLAKRSP